MESAMFTSEQDLADIYLQDIQPFWQKKVVQGKLVGIENIPIAYAYVVHPEPVGSVVFSSGRIETLLKYKELVYDLYQQGYSVFIHDHRGQGLSGRMLNNPQLGYVKQFDDYVSDLKLFVDQVVIAKSTGKPNLLCHSMGGAIGFLAVMRFPDVFRKVVFSAPMFGIRPALPHWLEKLLLNIHFSIHKNVAYFMGQKNYANHSFAENELTHSEPRYQIFRQEYENAQNVQLGGVTGDWLKAALSAMNQIEKAVDAFPIPAMVFQAGHDQVVDNKRQARVARNMANTDFIVIQGASHEILMEQDQYRNQCLSTLLTFIAD